MAKKRSLVERNRILLETLEKAREMIANIKCYYPAACLTKEIDEVIKGEKNDNKQKTRSDDL